MKNIIGLVVLSLVVWNLLGCGSLQTAPSATSNNYADKNSGFSLYVPAGWNTDASAGMILVTKDINAYTGVIIYPVQLTATGESLSTKQFMGQYFEVLSSISSEGNSLSLTWASSSEENSISSGSFTGRIKEANVANETNISGEVSCSKSGKELILKIFWATTSTFNDEKETLQKIVNSYSKLTTDINYFLVKKETKSDSEKSVQFTISYPNKGWNVSTNASGAMISSTDSSEAVEIGITLNTLYTAQGLVDLGVQGYITAGYLNFTTTSEKTYPPNDADKNGNVWNYYSREVTFKDPTGHEFIGVFYTGMTTSYGITYFVYSWKEKWETEKNLLTAIQQKIGISITKLAQPSTSYAALPKNNPLDNSSTLSSWEYKNRVDDRLSAVRQESMMGYQRGADSSGNTYDMPLNTYDSTISGYRNPNNPSETLTLVNE